MATVYQQVLGAEFDSLDSGVRRFHLLQENHRLSGRCSIRGAESWFGRMACRLLQLPQANPDARMEFELNASEAEETWIRHFPQRTMRSVLKPAAGGLLGECLGPTRLLFSLSANDGQLSMRLERIRIFGLPWPMRWFPQVWANERGGNGRFHFDVGARLRRFGLLVAYSGYLDLDETDSKP